MQFASRLLKVGRATLLLALSFCAITSVSPASAIEVVLKDAAPDRIERQRANARGDGPLPFTPTLSKLDERLRTAGLKRGDHVFIRIFKEESELELWMAKDGRYVRFATYPICFWSGSLGPKLFEGDKQTPEGVYTVGRRQLRLIGRWPRSLNLWFPNAYDKANDRTGSYILIHGGCSSIGCYALTDDVLDEVHGLVSRAVRRGGQRLMHVHAFPFRMTEANLARHAGSKWTGFWRDLKVAYDIFNETKIPPQVGVCDTRYVFAKATFRQSSRMAIRRLRQRPAPIAARETEELQATGEPGSTTEASRDELLCIEPDVTAETEDVGVPREASFTLAPASRR